MALSNAERQRRYIARLRAKAAVTDEGDAVIAQLKARIRELKKENTALATRLIAGTHKPRAVAVTGEGGALARAKARIRDLENEKAALAGRLAASAPPPVSDGAAERMIKGLKTANRNLRARLSVMNAFYQEQSRLKGVMPQTTYAALMKVLHPDRPPPSDGERGAACGLLSRWKQDAGKVRR